MTLVEAHHLQMSPFCRRVLIQSRDSIHIGSLGNTLRAYLPLADKQGQKWLVGLAKWCPLFELMIPPLIPIKSTRKSYSRKSGTGGSSLLESDSFLPWKFAVLIVNIFVLAIEEFKLPDLKYGEVIKVAFLRLMLVDLDCGGIWHL
jgi:hypothetical protein